MGDLIRRSDAIKAIWGAKDINPSEDGQVFEAQSHIDRDIRLIPAVEPKQGEWIDYSIGSGCYCSNCEWDGDDALDECIMKDFEYCPNCGAKMKGADDE